MKKLSLEEPDKLMIRDLKRAYNEGLKSAIEFLSKGDYLYKIQKKYIKKELKKLLLK